MDTPSEPPVRPELVAASLVLLMGLLLTAAQGPLGPDELHTLLVARALSIVSAG